MLRRTSLAALAALAELAALAALAAPFGFAACASSASEPPPSPGVETPPAPSAPRPAAYSLDLHGPLTLGAPLADDAPAYLAVSLRIEDEAGLAQLLSDQQNASSPRYHAWLTPQDFGARFGLPVATYARIVSWLAAEGFAVTQYPNRLFVEGHGTVAGVRRLLRVQPRTATKGAQTFRSYSGELSVPDDIAPLVAKIGGLDTRLRLRHRLDLTPFQGQPTQALGAADMRVLYDSPSDGSGASGLTLAVLGTQEGTQANQNANPGPPFIPPSVQAIQAYLTTIANATVAYNPIVLPNTQNDLDVSGSNQEYQLDVEMQSVGAPNAKDIDLVLSPSSVVFQTGAQYIVNTLSSAVAVSTSLGDCESEEVEDDGGINTSGSDAYLMRMAVKQGLSEGQAWFAAAGDNGADDCADNTSDTGNGFGGGNATVDFPCSLPEIVCLGGTQFEAAGNWNAAGNLTAWQAEEVWNEGSQGGAGGGGQSLLYPKPTWQVGVGPKASDGARDVPDISLTAATATPGVAVYDCGSGQDQLSCSTNTVDAGQMDIFGGTSIASPLAAGFFAHLAGQLGCRLGDIHPALYALGAGQQDGGAQPFHDITAGNNSFPDPKNVTITGFTAGPGYDLASGWGSFDLAKLIDSWPPCGGDGGPVPLGDGGAGSGDDGGGQSIGGEDSGVEVTLDAGGGNGATGGSGNGQPSGSSGCSCKAAGASPSGGSLPGFVALGPLALLFAARRRRRASDGG
ncbi:MAG: protease pro-enzyme activation domain-containing protein [Polyangiaceae bacterium]